MSSSNRHPFVEDAQFDPFDFAFKSDDSPMYHGPISAQPLRFTKSNNAVPSFSHHPRPDSSMLRSHSDFDFSVSSTGVGAGYSIPPFPGQASASSSFQIPGPLPIKKFLNDSNSPWTGLQTPRNSQDYPGFAIDPNLNFATYRQQPQSEIESNTTAQCPSDSGYASQPVASQSVKSGEYSSNSPDYSFYPDFETFDLSPMPKASVSPQQAEEGGTMKLTHRSRGGTKKCEKCSKIMQCPSDYRKHMLKHDKPNKCDFQGCTRVDGFSTINDLQRHQKTRHGIGVHSITTSFKCASLGCKNQEKIWPRRDNFKQHILRMHKEEDVNELILRSEIKSGTSTDGASIEADVAGMSRYAAEPQPPTVRPGELDMDNPDSLVTHNAAWLLSALSDEPLAHRSDSIPARDRRSQIPVNYSSFHGRRGNNAPSQNLDTRATFSAIHPALGATTVSSPGHGYASNISSSLASPARQMVYNDAETEQTFHNLSFSDKVAIFENAPDEERKRILEIIGPDGLRVANMEHDDRSSASSPGPRTKKRNKVCTTCGKAFEKKASLKKHMQRHSRPWACTHFGCGKTFGAKDDWKRHERSQAPQAELWRCQLADPDPASSSGKCGIVEFDRHCFHDHLREDHNLTVQTQIDNLTLECKIGYSHQWLNAYSHVNFWCGFCKEIIQAKHDPCKLMGSTGVIGNGKGQDDNDPASHRWDHIDAHFKEGKTIESWLFWEANKTFREIENLKDAKFVWDVYGKENPEKEKLRKQRAAKEKLDTSISRPQVGEKRKADNELGRPERRPRGRTTMVTAFWHCCECGNGPISIKLHASCPGRENGCSHVRCKFCEGNYANDGGELEVLANGPYDSWRNEESPLAEKIMDLRGHEKAERGARFVQR